MDNRKTAPKASIIIPVKNGGKLFERVLDATLAQDVPWPFEVLVIDSGSCDGSCGYARSRDVHVLEIDPRDFGHGRTRNLGASLTTGEFIVFLTHDALPTDTRWLKNLIDACDMDPSTAGAFGRHIAYPEASSVTRRELAAHFAGFGEKTTVFRMEDPARYAREEGYRQFLHFFSNNNSCLRRSVWERHPFPEVDFAEDQIWAKTVIEAGYGKAYAPDACVYHSHDFGVFETARRSFDESRALHRIFGYVLVPSVYRAVRTWAYLVHRNRAWIREEVPDSTIRLMETLKSPAFALAKVAGLYLGGREASLPAWTVSRLSRDKALQSR